MVGLVLCSRYNHCVVWQIELFLLGHWLQTTQKAIGRVLASSAVGWSLVGYLL